MLRFYTSVAVILSLWAPASVNAQQLDPTAPTFSGSTNLRQSFRPDPRSVRVTSGGDINVQEEFDSCVGYVSSAPDYRVRFTRRGNSALPLIFYVDANHDTTLVINDANGEWFCDDDSGGGTRPMISFTYPDEGTYDIWVGNYEIDEQYDATLRITERTR